MENIISNEEIMTDATQENVYVANDKIDLERIRTICRESDFARENQMTEHDGGYISNFDFRLNVDFKKQLGAEDIFDEEIFLAYLAPFCSLDSGQFIPGNFSGGFMITKFGVFSASFVHSNPFGVHIPFEKLAEAQTIQEGHPDIYAKYSVIREPYGGTYHWLMSDGRHIAFFVYGSAYADKPLVALFREIASSVRRDLGIGRVNIPQAPQA